MLTGIGVGCHYLTPLVISSDVLVSFSNILSNSSIFAIVFSCLFILSYIILSLIIKIVHIIKSSDKSLVKVSKSVKIKSSGKSKFNIDGLSTASKV